MKRSIFRWSLGETRASVSNPASGSSAIDGHDAADLRRQIARPSLGQAAEARSPGDQPLPDRLDADAERRHESHAGDDDPLHGDAHLG